MLFQADIRQQTPDEAIAGFYQSLCSPIGEEETPVPDRFMEELVRGTIACMPEIDRKIAGHSEHWRLDRMPVVDRNILRLAAYEMANVGTPVAVVIDEALELARRFSSGESVAFVNGVLDAVRRASEQVQETATLLPDTEGGKDPV